MIAATISSDLFRMGVPALEKALRTAAVYGAIVVLLRVTGKRSMAQLNTLDLVVLLLLSNVVQNAIIGEDNSLLGGLLGATILVLLNSAIVRVVRRNATAVRLFEGTPTDLVRDGVLDEVALRHLGLRSADVVVALRRQGANTVGEVRRATLEPGGTIVVELREEEENATKSDVERLEAKLDRLLAGAGG